MRRKQSLQPIVVQVAHLLRQDPGFDGFLKEMACWRAVAGGGRQSRIVEKLNWRVPNILFLRVRRRTQVRYPSKTLDVRRTAEGTFFRAGYGSIPTGGLRQAHGLEISLCRLAYIVHRSAERGS